MPTVVPGRSRILSAIGRRLRDDVVPPFEIVFADGHVEQLGGTASDSAERVAINPAFRVVVRTAAGERALAALDELAIGEAYLAGEIDVEGDFLTLMSFRRFLADRHPLLSLWRFLLPRLRGQIGVDNRNTPRHYDHGNEFYFSFLDHHHRLYSQALFKSGTESLEEAAANKLDYIREICRVGPGSRILDVGAGWGSFARHAASAGAHVTMLTVSREQERYLAGVAADCPGPGTLTPVLCNVFEYARSEPFDAAVILGVMEHLPDYRRFLARMDALVRPHGRVYMDFAATREKFDIPSFAYRHVFPGNHSPVHMPGLIEAVNQSPFEIVAVHNDRHSYFLTLTAWARRLEAAAERLARDFGEHTVRLFRLYLWSTAHAMGETAALESFRIVVQKSAGRASREVGL